MFLHGIKMFLRVTQGMNMAKLSWNSIMSCEGTCANGCIEDRYMLEFTHTSLVIIFMLLDMFVPKCKLEMQRFTH